MCLIEKDMISSGQGCELTVTRVIFRDGNRTSEKFGRDTVLD